MAKTFETVVAKYTGNRTSEFPNGKIYLYNVTNGKEVISKAAFMESVITAMNEAGYFISAVENFDTIDAVIIFTREL